MRCAILSSVESVESAGALSSSRRRPSGVSSNTQEITGAGIKQITSTPTTVFITQLGASNTGNRVTATCTINQAPTKYSPAMRMTLRRLSSARSFISSPSARAA
jgi:hypothetical protein